jgi:Papain-like cysteine protease AvrRpt2
MDRIRAFFHSSSSYPANHHHIPPMRRQEATNWCWASAIQSVIAQRGIVESQMHIAGRLDGWPRNRPAHITEVAGLLRSYGLNAMAYDAPANPLQLNAMVQQSWKVIAFVYPIWSNAGHFIVIQGINPTTGKVAISDPLSGAMSTTSLPHLYGAWRWSGAVVVN